jgi:transposase
MTKSTRARYTLEFKEEAVRLVTGGVRWTPLVRQLGWRVKRESRGIIAPCRCWGSVSARAAG